jgi:hypothetical protein
MANGEKYAAVKLFTMRYSPFTIKLFTIKINYFANEETQAWIFAKSPFGTCGSGAIGG